MNILYFGTICDLDNYDKLLMDSALKPSVAPVVFESALLKGFKENGADVEIHSFPMIPTFPSFKKLVFGGNTEILPCGYSCRWLKTLNLPILKQISRRRDARKIIKKWAKENHGEGIIFTYSIPPFLVNDVIRYSKKYKLKSIAIIPDLLRDMYINENNSSFVTKLKNLYLKPALKVQSEYNGYIYLTDAMHSVVAPDKPYCVMEGIADTDIIRAEGLEEKGYKRAVMYAGMLHEKYGIINLLDAFSKLDDVNVELWLFGDGTAVSEIKSRAEKDSRIKYFGVINRSEILEYERKATVLVNPRDHREEFTEFSFPSKTIEYMMSGTPLITTKLKGIPDEYFDYVFTAESNSSDDLKYAFDIALNYSDRELSIVGENAQNFIKDNKNAYVQAKKILEFMKEGVEIED